MGKVYTVWARCGKLVERCAAAACLYACYIAARAAAWSALVFVVAV